MTGNVTTSLDGRYLRLREAMFPCQSPTEVPVQAGRWAPRGASLAEPPPGALDPDDEPMFPGLIAPPFRPGNVPP